MKELMVSISSFFMYQPSMIQSRAGNFVIAFLFVAIASLSVARAEDPVSYGFGLVGDEELVLGGSFSPPTLEHAGLVVRLMKRFGFARARLIPAVPYKKGAAPAAVSMGLTRVAVNNFDEVLAINGIQYQNFRNRDSNGSSSWEDQSGRTSQIVVDDYDIKNLKTPNTVTTLTYLARTFGGPKKIYNISGGDSFASIPTWGPTWPELFEQANWIVVARPGFDEGPKDIRFDANDPLRPVFGDEFVARYTYSFDQEQGIHWYRPKQSGRPSIMIVNQAVLNDSSSANRADLAKPGDHAHAQAGLQPSVFKECVRNRYYDSDQANIGVQSYDAFTPLNMQIYLQHLFAKAQVAHKLSANDQKDFTQISSALVASTVQLAKEAKDRTFSVTVLTTFTESVIEKIRHLKNVAGLHDYALFKTLSDYRSRLMRGDPEAVLARNRILAPLGIDDESVILNVVQSKLPAWVPLWMRGIHNRRFNWYDVNISTNELRNMLGDKKLALQLRNKAGGSRGLESQLLLAAVTEKPEARFQMEYLATYRYFLNVGMGDMTDEIKSGYSPAEQKTITELSLAGLRYRSILNVREFRFLKEMTAHLYTILGMARIEPELVYRHSYSEIFTDMLATGYPGKKWDPKSVSQTQALASKLQIIAEVLSQLPQANLAAWDWTYRGREVLERSLEKNGRSRYELRTDLKAVFEKTIRTPFEISRWNLLSQSLASYFQENQNLVFRDVREGGGSERSSRRGLELLPTLNSDPDNARGNLIWEINVYQALVKSGLRKAQIGFEKSLEYLATRPHPRDIETILHDQRRHELEDVHRLQARLLDLEYRWLQVKITYQGTAHRLDETKIPDYQRAMSDFTELRVQLTQKLLALETISHVASGVRSVDLNHPEAVRALLTQEIQLGRNTSTPLRCENIFGATR